MQINLSPQRAQRTQSSTVTFVLWYGIAPQRIRTRMTLIGRIFTDIFNIFGVPFTFLPHESKDGPPPPPPVPKTLDAKGQDTQQDKKKRKFLDEWVKAVNLHGGFGIWQWSVSKDPADIAEILEKASGV